MDGSLVYLDPVRQVLLPYRSFPGRKVSGLLSFLVACYHKTGTGGQEETG